MVAASKVRAQERAQQRQQERQQQEQQQRQQRQHAVHGDYGGEGIFAEVNDAALLDAMFGDTMWNAPPEPIHEEDDGASIDDSFATGSTAPFDLPASFGEQLVLETYLRCRKRPYDRKRQDVLAMPRRAKPSPDAWGIRGSSLAAGGSSSVMGSRSVESSMASASPGPLGKRQLASLVQRLSQPKKALPSISSGEAVVRQMQLADRQGHVPEEKTPQEKTVRAAEVADLLKRLSQPKTPPASSSNMSEQLLRMTMREQSTPDASGEHRPASSASRSPNFDRLAEMAKPRKSSKGGFRALPSLGVGQRLSALANLGPRGTPPSKGSSVWDSPVPTPQPFQRTPSPNPGDLDLEPDGEFAESPFQRTPSPTLQPALQPAAPPTQAAASTPPPRNHLGHRALRAPASAGSGSTPPPAASSPATSAALPSGPSPQPPPAPSPEAAAAPEAPDAERSPPVELGPSLEAKAAELAQEPLLGGTLRPEAARKPKPPRSTPRASVPDSPLGSSGTSPLPEDEEDEEAGGGDPALDDLLGLCSDSAEATPRGEDEGSLDAGLTGSLFMEPSGRAAERADSEERDAFGPAGAEAQDSLGLGEPGSEGQAEGRDAAAPPSERGRSGSRPGSRAEGPNLEDILGLCDSEDEQGDFEDLLAAYEDDEHIAPLVPIGMHMLLDEDRPLSRGLLGQLPVVLEESTPSGLHGDDADLTASFGRPDDEGADAGGGPRFWQDGQSVPSPLARTASGSASDPAPEQGYLPSFGPHEQLSPSEEWARTERRSMTLEEALAQADVDGDAALNACDTAVAKLDQVALEELRLQESPPVEVIQVLCACSLLLNGVSLPADWAHTQRLLTNSAALLERLRNFDAREISPGVLRSAEEIVRQPVFSDLSLASASSAAGCLAVWAKSTVAYNQVYHNMQALLDTAEEDEEYDEVARKSDEEYEEEDEEEDEEEEGLVHVMASRDDKGSAGFGISPTGPPVIVFVDASREDVVQHVRVGDLVIAVNGVEVADFESYRRLAHGRTEFRLTLRPGAEEEALYGGED